MLHVVYEHEKCARKFKISIRAQDGIDNNNNAQQMTKNPLANR